ncbi:MAG: hypothetical protein Q4G34_04845 [Micrococcus sp.]|nr:hypothetical protein [Micrococcus sp.]
MKKFLTTAAAVTFALSAAVPASALTATETNPAALSVVKMTPIEEDRHEGPDNWFCRWLKVCPPRDK